MPRPSPEAWLSERATGQVSSHSPGRRAAVFPSPRPYPRQPSHQCLRRRCRHHRLSLLPPEARTEGHIRRIAGGGERPTRGTVTPRRPGDGVAEPLFCGDGAGRVGAGGDCFEDGRDGVGGAAPTGGYDPEGPCFPVRETCWNRNKNLRYCFRWCVIDGLGVGVLFPYLLTFRVNKGWVVSWGRDGFDLRRKKSWIYPVVWDYRNWLYGERG